MHRFMYTQHLLRLSQMPGLPPPAPPMPAPGGMGDPGLGGLGGITDMGAPAGPAEGEQDSVISGPLDSIDQILVDADMKKKLAEPEDLENIILEIWEAYGGAKDSIHVYPNKVGRRSNQDEKRSPEEIQKEREETEEKKWERLPEGKTLATLDPPVTFEELSKNIKKMVMPIVKEMKGKAGPPGGEGGMPGMPPI